MSHYFGLYFGNTNLCLAVDRNGTSEVLANSAGDRLTPAVVATVNGEKCVGLAAKQCMMRNAGNIVVRVKSLIADDTCTGDEDDEDTRAVTQNGNSQQLKTYDALVLLFKNMVTIAQSHSHETDVPVVVTVPHNFSSKLRKFVESVAVDAGFRFLRVISEPSAAALAYGLGQESQDTNFNCLIYRIGGSSVDVTIFKVHGGVYHSLVSLTKTDFGGNVFTEKLADFVANEFQKQYKVDVRENKRSVMKLRSAAEACKHALSIMRSAQCFAESIYDGIDLSIHVSQARFEALISSDLQLCIEAVTETLDEACLTESEIHKVVLAGGSSKIPKLQQLFAEKFSAGALLSSISPDEVIAVGAAKEAALISYDRPLMESDCFVNTLSSGVFLRKVESEDQENPDLIPLFCQGIPVPASCQISLPVDEVSSVSFEVCEKQNVKNDSKLKVLCKFTVKPTIEMSLGAEIMPDRSIKLCCKDITTGLSKLIII